VNKNYYSTILEVQVGMLAIIVIIVIIVVFTEKYSLEEFNTAYY